MTDLEKAGRTLSDKHFNFWVEEVQAGHVSGPDWNEGGFGDPFKTEVGERKKWQSTSPNNDHDLFHWMEMQRQKGR